MPTEGPAPGPKHLRGLSLERGGPLERTFGGQWGRPAALSGLHPGELEGYGSPGHSPLIVAEPSMLEIKVPARICLYGDHQDYLDLPVIAATIDRFVHIRALPNEKKLFSLKLLDMGEEISLALDDPLIGVVPGDFFRSGLAILKAAGLQFDRGYDLAISGNIPINAGLSSSSALLVAWIRFLVAVQRDLAPYSDFQIGHWAYQAEVVYFDSPGGLMDQYTIAQGGMRYI